MRNLLALVATAALTFAVVGYYLDWYKIKSDSGPTGHQSVNIDFNKVKIAEDVHKGVEKGEKKLQGVLEKEAAHASDTVKPLTSSSSATGNPFSDNSTDQFPNP